MLRGIVFRDHEIIKQRSGRVIAVTDAAKREIERCIGHVGRDRLHDRSQAGVVDAGAHVVIGHNNLALRFQVNRRAHTLRKRSLAVRLGKHQRDFVVAVGNAERVEHVGNGVKARVVEGDVLHLRPGHAVPAIVDHAPAGLAGLPAPPHVSFRVRPVIRIMAVRRAWRSGGISNRDTNRPGRHHRHGHFGDRFGIDNAGRAEHDRRGMIDLGRSEAAVGRQRAELRAHRPAHLLIGCAAHPGLHLSGYARLNPLSRIRHAHHHAAQHNPQPRNIGIMRLAGRDHGCKAVGRRQLRFFLN